MHKQWRVVRSRKTSWKLCLLCVSGFWKTQCWTPAFKCAFLNSGLHEKCVMVVVLIDLSYRMSYGIFLYFIHSVFQKTSSCFEREIFKVHYNCRGFSGFSFFILPMNILDIPDAICDLLQEKGPSNFAFPTAFRRSQLDLTAFQRFWYISSMLKLR